MYISPSLVLDACRKYMFNKLIKLQDTFHRNVVPFRLQNFTIFKLTKHLGIMDCMLELNQSGRRTKSDNTGFPLKNE